MHNNYLLIYLLIMNELINERGPKRKKNYKVWYNFFVIYTFVHRLYT